MENKQQAKQAAYCDKDRMTEALSSEKFLSAVYNESLNEAYHAPVKNCFCGLLDDVHRTGEEIFAVMIILHGSCSSERFIVLIC